MSAEMENQPEETQPVNEAPAAETAVETQEAAPAPSAEQKPQISDEDLKKTLECLLFITDRPLPTRELTKACGLSVKESHRVGALLAQIREELEHRGAPYQAIEVADGWQMATRTSYAPYVRKIFAERMTLKLSTAAHETLAIVAYKQPITRAEIEDVRGVEVIAALETLLEKRLIKVVGRKETVGRPLMYGTTVEFLRHFGLASLEDMPPLDSFTPKQEITAASETPAEPAGETVTPTPDTLAQAEAAVEAEAPKTEAQAEIEEAKKESLWPSDEDTSSGQ